MASLMSEVNALAARCRKVGWEVETQGKSGGGWRIVNKEGAVYNIHGTYSDRNAIHKVRRDLDDMGLSAAEEAMRSKRDRDKAAKMAADRKAADLKAQRLAAQSTLAKLAAGPYAGPEEVGVDWFLAEHPAPWMRWVIITPAIAAAMMARNTGNRPLKLATVQRYQRVIEAGGWHLTHQGIAMDVNGVLQDGQHRLQAIIDADVDVAAAVFVGMPPENFKAIDEGRNRTVADLLGLAGERGSLGQLAAMVRLVAASREANAKAFIRMKPTNETLFDAFKGDPERLRQSFKWATLNYQSAKIPVSALGAARYLLTEVNGDTNAYVLAFLRGLVTGVKANSRVMLDADDPRFLMRQTLQQGREQRRRREALEQLGMILDAWNRVVVGKQPGKRYKRKADAADLPMVLVCHDKGRRASAPPTWLTGEIIDKGGAS